MAYDEFLADRIRLVLQQKKVESVEKKMMGGLCFMVDNKMCVGINKDDLMCRVGKNEHANALTKPGCKEMTFTGRSLGGYVWIEPEAVDQDSQLEYWIDQCLAFNPLAKASKKKKPKVKVK